MQRIPILLRKIGELVDKQPASIIEIDLMLDYTKVMYADLLEMREKIALNESLKPKEEEQSTAMPEPQEEILQQTATTEDEQPAGVPEPEYAEEDNMQETEQADADASIAPLSTVKNTDIRSLIGINDKYQFISELFGNNKDLYNEVLNEINNFSGYKEATEWLERTVAEDYKWDKENLTVEMFYSTLSQFFSSI